MVDVRLLWEILNNIFCLGVYGLEGCVDVYFDGNGFVVDSCGFF